MGKQGFKKTASPSSTFYKSNLGNTTKPPFSKPNPLEVLKEHRKLPASQQRRPERNPTPKERDQKKRSRKPNSNRSKPQVNTLKTQKETIFQIIQDKPVNAPIRRDASFNQTDKYSTTTLPTAPPIIRVVPQVPAPSFSQTANYGSNAPYQLQEAPVAKTTPPKLPPAAFKSAGKINLLFDTSPTRDGDKVDLDKNMKLRVLMGVHLDKYNIRPHETQAAQKAQSELIQLKLGSVNGSRFTLTPLGQFIGDTLEHLGDATLHSIKLNTQDARTQALLEQGLVKKGHVEIDITKEHLFKTPHIMQLLHEENVDLANHPARVQLKLPRLVFTKDGSKLHALLSIFSLRNRAGTVTPPPTGNESSRVVERRGLAELSDSLADNLQRHSGFRRQWGVSTKHLPTVVEDLRRIARNEALPKYQRPRRETMQLPAIPLQATKKEHVAIWRRVANAFKAGFAEFKRR